ncbi:MAG: Asp-tRNA(Asn)/Glu-tRNA(Gln) amidotransferase subunit GatC [Salibacteraceae bacterium]
MKVDDKLVDHLSHLARLRFEDSAREDIKTDLGRILDFVEKLSELDTDDVQPLIYMTEAENVVREDQSQLTVTKEEALKNAPVKDSDYFKVPKVINK